MAYYDITQLVIAETDIDEQVARLKDDVCIGNEKGSWLNKVEAYIDPGSAKIVIEVRLRNRHVWDTPFGKVVAYSDTFSVWFTGIVDSNCIVGAYVVTSSNEVWKVLGGFATLLVNSSGLSILITNKICPLIGIAPSALLDQATIDEYATPSLSNVTASLETSDLFRIDYSSCIPNIADPASAKIKCVVSLSLSDAGKEQFREATYGILTSLSCEIPIDLLKSDLTGIFKQNQIVLPRLALEIVLNPESQNGRLPINTKLDTTVAFMDSVAINATIRISETEGIPVFLAGRLEREVNGNRQIPLAIVNFVNSLPR